MEATGLLKAITQPSFLFIACMTHQILSLLDPPNTALQAKSTDLYTGVRPVQSALTDRQTTEPAAVAPPTETTKKYEPLE